MGYMMEWVGRMAEEASCEKRGDVVGCVEVGTEEGPAERWNSAGR